MEGKIYRERLGHLESDCAVDIVIIQYSVELKFATLLSCPICDLIIYVLLRLLGYYEGKRQNRLNHCIVFGSFVKRRQDLSIIL